MDKIDRFFMGKWKKLRKWLNSKPYWLRGALIAEAILISFLLFLYLLVIIDAKEILFGSKPFGLLFALVYWPLYILFHVFIDREKVALYVLETENYTLCLVIGFFFLLSVYFATGALIGWIIGKIKQKNQIKK
ncbi:hypothetical protein KY347_00600 [Candidatus Woesearchaeota archaeon]|nr:hypothetical protein [Candidatus Woesearchaeota archaeon]